ncbi:NifB/NifX family molybdenum-iron cluster-binding protein [Marinospirillum alkaliphilum]|uniref:Nitrogen fixation protein NifX n=1 Tax=Marinospirillum alkaliphilum DSM 21637 TaxID=1122209 RepID=A0A1K1TLR2_9GAMM|nr:NifB/NifX family molybdenum-iron cluster-binding protein [Marinospirillum alkaliphilum]SFX01402.1 nitrogen fixation protein NifX [Marinospirillum alkaliphilum DSM 21637]
MRHLKLVSNQTPLSQQPVLRIAFASSDRQTINQHFGAAEAFVIFELRQNSFQLAEVAEFHGRDTARDGHEGKLEAKVALLQGCAAVYCNAVGASAIRQLLAANIQPLKVDEGLSIESQLRLLTEEWQQEPPVWMQRSLRQQQRSGHNNRFADMAAESWSEEG